MKTIKKLDWHIQLAYIFMLMTWISCDYGNPWALYSEEQKQKILKDYEIFAQTEFTMTIEFMAQVPYKGKLDPAWFVGKVIDYKTGSIWDSIIPYESDYFDFSRWPIVRLRADHESNILFHEGDILIKREGTSEIMDMHKPEDRLSIFPPLRSMEKKKRQDN